MNHCDVTVIIPTIPPRAAKLQRAVRSVVEQTVQPAVIMVEFDHEHTGSADTRNRAISKASTEYLTFLDDDDVLLPHFLERTVAAAQGVPADVVFGKPYIPQRRDHEDSNGLPDTWVFDDEGKEDLLRTSRVQTTSLVRTKLAQQVGGFEFRYDPKHRLWLDDWGFFTKLVEAGAVFHRIPEYLFEWHVDGQNTSGKPDRW